MDDDEHKVYDPHDEQPVVRPNLGEAYESEQERMLHAKQPPRDIVKHALRNAEDQGATTSATPSDAVSHTGGGAPASNIPGDLLGRESDSLYNPVQDQPKGAGLRKFLGKAKTGAKKHKKKIWIAAGGVGGIFVLFMLLLFLLGSLLIPHFFQNMLAYRFANSARSFRQANEQILSREMADQAASDSRWDQIKSKYQNVKSFATLAKYRPAAIVRNLKATGALDFVYEPRSNAAATLLRGPRMTAIKINGQEIPLTAKSKLGIPFSAASDNIRLSASIDQALATSWKGPQGPLAILRTATGAKILQDIGWNGF